MTRRKVLVAIALALSWVSFPAAARPAGKATRLEVTYYYLPG